MSSLNRIFISGVDGPIVSTTFLAVHPDVAVIPSAKNVALQVIIGAFWQALLEHEENHPRRPGGADPGADLVFEVVILLSSPTSYRARSGRPR